MSNKYVKEDIKSALSLHPGGIQLTLHNAELAGISAGDTVLDIGCGTGASLAVLKASFGIDAYGIDISEQILSIAHTSNPDISYEYCDAYSLPYPDAFYDAVMMECVLTLLDDPAAALSQAARVLKNDGRLIISTLVSKEPCNSESVICSNGLAYPAALTAYLQSLGLELLHSEDNKKELTDYMIESILEYGSLDERIKAETSLTGASVFDCSCCYDPKNITYCSFVFTKVR